MKKLILSIIMALFMTMSFSSCTVQSYATTQDDIYAEARADIVSPTVEFAVILQHGKPYYHNGSLLYYLYDGLYYYPYWYGNQWYVRCYRKPFTHLMPPPYFRPSKYDMRFKPNIYKGYGVPRQQVRPQNRRVTPQQIPNRSVRRDVQNAIRRSNGNRPAQQPRRR